MKRVTISLMFLAFFLVSSYSQYANKSENKSVDLNLKKEESKGRELSSILVGIGVSYTNINVGDGNNVGTLVDISLYSIHFDFASNFAFGKGKYLYYANSEIVDPDKQAHYIVNLGYDINLSEAILITPKTGIVILDDVWQDPLGKGTYYHENAGTKFQAGADVKYLFKKWYVKAGVSSAELFSFAVGARIRVFSST